MDVSITLKRGRVILNILCVMLNIFQFTLAQLYQALTNCRKENQRAFALKELPIL